MKVSIRIEMGDYQAFLKWIKAQVARTQSRLSTSILLIPFGLGFGLFLANFEPAKKDKTYLVPMAGFIGGIAFLYVLSLFLARGQRKLLAPAEVGYVFGPQTIELLEDGIRVNSLHHEASFRWSLVTGPEITDKHLFILVDRIAAIIIPRAGFASEIEYNQFVEQIRVRAQRSSPYWKTPAR